MLGSTATPGTEINSRRIGPIIKQADLMDDFETSTIDC